MPGSMPSSLEMRAHLPDLLHLGQEVVQGEVLALLGRQLGGHLLGLFLAERLLRLLDQGEQVTHVEDAGGHPVRVEGVEVVELLAVRREHDRLAGDRARSTGRHHRGRHRRAWRAPRRRSRRRRGRPRRC